MENFLMMKTAKDLPTPSYMTAGAAGLDLYANIAEEVIIRQLEIKAIPTGVKISIPEGYEAQIRPRSGLALKHGITMINAVGTVDSDYRGEIVVPLINLGVQDYTVKRGDRIAQMVITKFEKAEFVITEKLDETERADKGFGHTGI
ncbi:MAG: dUTP diphosphatase [Clostridiales bacterium]|jgi:dUTP pyrophosphatase|nr:dUTP diphosphatase [Clostridiales bacterium]